MKTKIKQLTTKSKKMVSLVKRKKKTNNYNNQIYSISLNTEAKNGENYDCNNSTEKYWNCEKSCHAIKFKQYFNVFVFAITFTKQLLQFS